MSPLDPVTLAGRHVTLVPLAAGHEAAVARAAGDLHALPVTAVPAPGAMGAEIARRLALHAAGRMLPFAVLAGTDRTPVGMTTFMNIDTATPRVEIGSTWYARAVQRTAVNTESKRLLLAHAFEGLGCPAVEFRTHWLNAASRRAIERLGAKLDGILRAHVRAPDGTMRDTCVYSIVAAEWPAVRASLDWALARPRP